MRGRVFLWASVLFSLSAFADTLPVYPIVHRLSVNSGYDYIVSSVGDELRPKIPADEKISLHSSVPVHLKYSFSFTNPEVRNYLPGGYQGIGLGVLNIGAAEKKGLNTAKEYIGNPILLYAFQGGPFFHMAHNLSLEYEWNFGASFGWKPYSPANEAFNLTVGSRVNAYINLGVNLKWQLTPKIGISGGVTASHFSNGNTSWPNPGVNSFGLRVGMEYTFNPPKDGYLPIAVDTVKRRKLEYDVSAWVAARKRVYKGGENPVLLPGRFACAGISFAPMVRFARWWRVGGSADIQWDESSDMEKNYYSGSTTEDIRFTRPDFFRQVSVGISAHGELQMPIFAVNIGIGYNLLAPKENRGLYQNITLKTYIGSKFFINVGYQLRNFQQQSSLMLGAGVTI